MIIRKTCKKYTSALVHRLFSRQTHRCNLFTKPSNKDTSKRLNFWADHSFTAMVYISLDTSTQALSPFWTSIISTLIRARLNLAQYPFLTPFLPSSRIPSEIFFSWKYIDSPLLSLPESWTWARLTLVLRRDPKCSQSAHFSLNVELPLPSVVLSDTAPDIDISTERIDRSIGKSVIKITSQSKGAEISISIRAAHRRRPGRYALSFAIHTDALVSCFIWISCEIAPPAPAWCSVSSLLSKRRF